MNLYIITNAQGYVTSCLYDPYPGATVIQVANDYDPSKAIYSKLVDGELIYDADRETELVQAQAGAMAATPPKSQLQILQETVDQLVLDSLGV